MLNADAVGTELDVGVEDDSVDVDAKQGPLWHPVPQ
jgi:hypothetical protein